MDDAELAEVQQRIAVAVRRRRRELGLTQERASQIIGMAPRHLQKLEAGEVNLTLRTLVCVSKGLGLNVKCLLCDCSVEALEDGS